jgi:hypothetical protein
MHVFRRGRSPNRKGTSRRSSDAADVPGQEDGSGQQTPTPTSKTTSLATPSDRRAPSSLRSFSPSRPADSSRAGTPRIASRVASIEEKDEQAEHMQFESPTIAALPNLKAFGKGAVERHLAMSNAFYQQRQLSNCEENDDDKAAASIIASSCMPLGFTTSTMVSQEPSPG